MKHFIEKCKAVFTINLLICILFLVFPTTNLTADKPLLAVEIKKSIKESHGYLIDVRVIPNKETKLQDLYIAPEKGENYPHNVFIHAVARAVSNITSQSFAYKLYTGMIIIEIGDELWAISAENCREAFNRETVEEQNSFLQKSFKRLR